MSEKRQIKKRAVHDEQKALRRQQILDKAWEMFKTTHYDDINIISIAKGVGLAKGTVYLYFPTKEALFLAILEQQIETWVDEIDQQLTAGETMTVIGISRLLAESIAARPSLARLFAIAHIILEHNIDFETTARYKTMLLGRIGHTGGLIENHLSFMRAGQGGQFLLRAYALIIGVENLASPAPIAREVIQGDAIFRPFDVDFRDELEDVLNLLLTGYQTRS